MRLLFKFFFLDIVSVMVVKFPGDFMGNRRVLLPGGLASSKVFRSFCGMEEVRCSVVDDWFSFDFQTQVSKQKRDSRVEPSAGATG